VKTLAAVGLALALLAAPPLVQAHEVTGRDQRLPRIGPAPDFALTSQDGVEVALKDFRGKVVAVTFIYTYCPDTCPLLTAKLAQVQDELGSAFGAQVAFISITVDPERDTPAVLKDYAQAFGANLAGWSFLAGAAAVIGDVTRRYGVFAAKQADGSVDHTSLTSLIDRRGVLRVQYIGWRFNPEEFRRDLQSLLDEP
jgi:protein SCO1/2